MTTFSEHPKIVFPAWLQVLGFTDCSYRNDCAARSMHEIPELGLDLLCWINYPDMNDREDPDNSVTYYVELVLGGQAEPVKEIYSGDSSGNAHTAISRILRAVEELKQ